jgi:hypothetical protein
MPHRRMIFAAALSFVVIALMAWQVTRERRIAACTAAGQVWNGPASRCEPSRSPILERDGLRRS